MSQQIAGEYIFNKQEMAAGFKFSDDEKFEFFFSYGAIDRTATGTFSVEGKTVKLKSDKIAGKDFNVTSQSKSGNGYSVKFEDPQPVFLQEIRCTFFINGERHDEYSNENGLVNVSYPHCDSIFVFHTLFPDFVTCIKDDKNENNNFTCTLNPSLAGVSFKGIDFTIDDDGNISCINNYFMPMEGIVFKRQ